VTYRPRVALPAALFLAAALLAACSSTGSGTPPPSGACVVADAGNAVDFSAKDTMFSAPCIEAAAGQPITIRFTNFDSVPHNVTVYRDNSKAEEIAHTETITGPNASSTVTVPAQDAGQLFYDCTIHPGMNGALVVKAASSASAS